ncbi:MAG: transcription elongation factor GreA [Peptoniphilaceae bacterium]|uniref:transcription elongation factor GreA n=1 Tax=Parvimonas sp. TaxID=1944660 RepID=UPI0025F42FA9|nr:transcription elongation factor GreA [Parvimonas sp.]MCI5996619.1 transcription elongation factor GreA [Parvimonas sp.]MDD7765257.1 transcription elongation factor GreA [Peptoniphilaceae bacterium]MDY3051339.1 transcription elongation factor GreA [Parvimonas sp.]
MDEKEIFLTAEGLKKLELELEELKTVKRKEIAEKIKIARDFGDLSENSEYDEAKNEQAQIEEKIARIDNMIANAKIIDDSEIDTKTVSVGATVTIEQKSTKKVMEYTIVGSAESNPLEGKISNESPVGRAILGKKKGSTVQVQLPNGTVTDYVIKNIKRN